MWHIFFQCKQYWSATQLSLVLHNGNSSSVLIHVFVSALIWYEYTHYYRISWYPVAHGDAQKHMSERFIYMPPPPPPPRTHFTNRFISSMTIRTTVSTARPFCRLTIVMQCLISTMDTDKICSILLYFFSLALAFFSSFYSGCCYLFSMDENDTVAQI